MRMKYQLERQATQVSCEHMYKLYALRFFGLFRHFNYDYIWAKDQEEAEAKAREYLTGKTHSFTVEV